MLLRDVRLDGRAVDVAVRRGRIAAIRPAGSPAAPGDGEELRLDGGHLVPGLWDEHVHLTQWALARRRIDLARAASAREAARRVAEEAAEPDDGLTLVGQGWRDGLWPDRPDRALLDAVAPDRPVVLVAADLHAAWVNRAAQVAYGLPDDPGGVLREQPCFTLVQALADQPDEIVDRVVADAGRAAAARGVVGVVDLEMTWNADVWRRRRAAGFDTQRIEFGVYPDDLDRAIGLGLRSGLALDELLSVGPFKVITDGSLGTRTAYCVEPYPAAPATAVDAGTGAAHPFGLLTVPPAELERMLRRAVEGGFLPAVHAIGDEANRLALDAFAATGATGRIEHAQLLRDDDLARFAGLGVVASVQPEHAMDDRDLAERFWPGRTRRAFGLRGLLDAGARLLLGSDAPVAPLDPWITMAAAVTRARDGREAWHPEQAIGVADALAASTRTRVSVGEPADLVVTGADPLTADGGTLRRMPVVLTMVGGRVTHRS